MPPWFPLLLLWYIWACSSYITSLLFRQHCQSHSPSQHGEEAQNRRRHQTSRKSLRHQKKRSSRRAPRRPREIRVPCAKVSHRAIPGRYRHPLQALPRHQEQRDSNLTTESHVLHNTACPDRSARHTMITGSPRIGISSVSSADVQGSGCGVCGAHHGGD